MVKDRKAQLEELEQKLGVAFSDKKLLDQALTHSSYSQQHHKTKNYERLEFFGDAVLKLVISEYLFHQFPDFNEGQLTKIRAVLVSDAFLANMGQVIELGQYLRLGPTERRTGGKTRSSNLANSLEALIGAGYLDEGMDQARKLILHLFEPSIMHVSEQSEIYDYKSTLQEIVQQQHLSLPEYWVAEEHGAEHQKIFTVAAKIKLPVGEIVGTGEGKTKKEAEQHAARNILIQVDAIHKKV